MAIPKVNVTNDNDYIKHEEAESLDMKDQLSVSGSQPDPESDDDTLDNEHSMNLYPNATDDNDTAELNIDEQLKKQEQEELES